MLGIDPEIGISALRLWLAAGSAALLVVLCAAVFARPQANLRGSLMRSGIVVLGAVFGASMMWAFLGGTAAPNQAAERRALELRAEALSAQALAPGSALACLNAVAGETIEGACEKAVFAAPATVATAISYVRARLALLSDMVAYTRHGGADIDGVLVPLRRSLEADPFGFLAYALAIGDGCTSQNCKALSLLHDPSRVRANLSGGKLDQYLGHYLLVWAQAPDRPLADAGGLTGAAQPGGPIQRKVMLDGDFPSAASIPPVSIMNPEPKGPVPPMVATDNPSPQPRPAAAERGPHKHTANAPAQTGAQDAASSPAAAADPVWVPAPLAAAPKAGAATAPVELNPFASPPEASAGIMHTQ